MSLTRFVGPSSQRVDGDGADAGLQPPSVLERLARPRPQAAGKVCELCSAHAGADHPHVVDVEQRALLCACRGCALLFTNDADVPSGRYQRVPDDYLRVEPFIVEPATWNALQIPVGTAFFMHHSQLDRTVAFYPSPGGATESELSLEAWHGVVDDNPALARLRPDVQAALVRTHPPGPAASATAPPSPAVCSIVPIDRCYELIGELRLHWRGFDGGQEVRERVDAFFADVDARAVPVS